MATKIQMRRGTAAAWTTANPTLAAGEPGYETDTGKHKIGDGATAWTALGYVVGSTSVVDQNGQPVAGKVVKVVLDANGEIDDIQIKDAA